MLRKKKKLRSERNSAPPIVILRELSDDELSGVVSGAAELLTPSYGLLFTMLLHTSGGSAPGKPKTALIIHLKYVEGQPANGVLLKNADFEYVLCLRSDLQPEVADAIQAEATQIIKAQANNPNFKARYWHDPSQASSEEAPDILTKSLPDTGDRDIIPSPMVPEKVEGGDHLTSHTPEQGDPSAAQGTNVREQPSNLPDQRPQAPKKGDVYDRDREHYSRERLQATAPTLSKLLLEAIANPDDPLSPSAVRALGEFAKDAVKIRGISANSAAREFNAPPDFFIRWAKELGIIPVLLEGTGQGSATILDREKAQEAADTFHEAKRQGIRPSKLHRKMASP